DWSSDVCSSDLGATDDPCVVGVDVVGVECAVGVTGAAGGLDVCELDAVGGDRVPVDVALPVADVDSCNAGWSRGCARLPAGEVLVFGYCRPGRAAGVPGTGIRVTSGTRVGLVGGT